MKQTLPFCLPAHISSEQFLKEYWQKKPLLIENGLPGIVDLLEPNDVMELAMADDVTARLLTQDNNNPDNWNVTFSPFSDDVLTQTSNHIKFWTLLVQNLEQWSLDIAQLWEYFGFLPKWQQDDIMVSFAPRGSSVGMHFDEYDVFLAQGFGQRRWQLGKFCDENTALQPNQPLKLITNMGDIVFDQVLNPGDVLYVPPKLSHFGVAQNDCLTFSFGLRRPNATDLFDTWVDEMSQHDIFKTPIVEQCFQSNISTSFKPETNGSISQSDINHFKTYMLNVLTSSQGDELLTNAIAKLLSNRRFELIPEDETPSTLELKDALNNGHLISKEPAIKLVYTENPLKIYCQGELLTDINNNEANILRKLANGMALNHHDLETVTDIRLVEWIENGWITLI